MEKKVFKEDKLRKDQNRSSAGKLLNENCDFADRSSDSFITVLALLFPSYYRRFQGLNLLNFGSI